MPTSNVWELHVHVCSHNLLLISRKTCSLVTLGKYLRILSYIPYMLSNTSAILLHLTLKSANKAYKFTPPCMNYDMTLEVLITTGIASSSGLFVPEKGFK